MNNLPAHLSQPTVTRFSSVNSRQYNRSCLYLSVYPKVTRDAVFKGHQASPCRNVDVIFLRGMPGQGKTHYCDTTIKPEHEIRQRHIQVISANLVAAKAQAKDKGIQLTDNNKNQLTHAYYRENAHRERKELMTELHNTARNEMKQALFQHTQVQHTQAGTPVSKPLTLVIDNSNIRSFELASYLGIAMEYAVPKENMSIIEVSPLNNGEFLQQLDKKLKEKGLKSSEKSNVTLGKWSELIFERSSERHSHPDIVYPAISSLLVQTVLCETLASMRVAPMKEDYMIGRLKSYYDNNQSINPGLLTSEATEMAADERAKDLRS
ncbi:hypothetical protein [Endozoicomonas sp. ONNA2]|uniref:hypothetical protein n=1 Tax=Endozoicomonas sp. ONNA2 TaxID=2828741 RepID=UPI00214931CF|nr:hypothetical protein [Endozoicomonas sp. ONNA2]